MMTLALLLPLCAGAQDTAATIVDRYLRMLNYEALPTDSLLVMETTVRYHGSDATFRMRRLYSHGNMMRVEVWKGDSLTTGYCTNGSTRFRKYYPTHKWWNDVPTGSLAEDIQPYDFRGPLYNWRDRGITLTYNGTTTLKGQTLQVVRAKQPNHFTRYYMFDAESGLLTLMLEKNEDDVAQKQWLNVKPIDFKTYHEFTPLGPCLLPSQESFMSDSLLTIMETKSHFEPRNDLLFNQD